MPGLYDYLCHGEPIQCDILRPHSKLNGLSNFQRQCEIMIDETLFKHSQSSYLALTMVTPGTYGQGSTP